MYSAYSSLIKFNVWLARNVFLFKRKEHFSVFRQLSPRRRDNVLDFGCNTGYLARMLKKTFGCDVAGCDIDVKALASARRFYPDIPFYYCDDDFFNSSTFDKIFISHVLEHAENPVEVLRNANRILKGGGRVVVSVPQERVRGELTFSLIVYSILRGRFENTHLRKMSLDLLKTCLDDAGFRLCDYEYVHIVPPFISKRYSWLFSMSLVVSAVKK